MKKIIIGIIIVVLIALGIIVTKNIFDSNKELKLNEETDDDELEWWIEESKKREEMIQREYVSVDMIMELTKRNPNWSKIDISKENLEKIKIKYPKGIFDGEEYDDVRLKEDYKFLVHDSEMGGDTFVLVATKNKKLVEYTILGEGGDILSKDRFGINTVTKKVIYDENGNRTKYPMDEENWLSNLKKIALQDNEEVGRSEKFDIEHPNFTGLLNPYNEDIDDLKIYILEERCDFTNKIYVCEVYYCNRYIYVTYKINYTVDDFNYLDTVEIEELNSREYEWDDYNKYLNSTGIAIKVLLRNRDMNKVPFTKKLINNLNNGLIGYDIVSFRRIKYAKGQNNNQNLYKIVLTNGKVKFIGLKYKFLNNKIDDIIVTELPITDETFNNYSTKELYDMF